MLWNTLMPGSLALRGSQRLGAIAMHVQVTSQRAFPSCMCHLLLMRWGLKRLAQWQSLAVAKAK